MIFLKKHLFLLIATLSLLTACQDPQSIEVNPEYAIPLINSSLTIQNLLDQANTGDIVNVGSDNFITVNYRKEVLGTDSVTLFEVPGFSIPQLLPIQTIPTPFPSDLEIDEIRLKGGKAYINFESNNLQPIKVTITFSDITKNNNVLTYERTITNTNGSVPFAFQDSIDLTNTLLDFSSNTFTTEYEAVDATTNLPVTISNIFLDFPVMDYNYVKGYFGERSFDLPLQELTMDVFNQWVDGTVSFTDPSLRLRFDNSYGFPLRVRFDTLQAISRHNGLLDIISNSLQNGVDLNYPALNEVGQEKTTNVNANKNNSNLVSVLGQAPYGLRYQFGGDANITGNNNIIGFITDQSKLTITVVAELPLEGALSRFTLLDTFDLDLTSVPRGDAEFKIIATNGFPIDIAMQCYFLDGFNNVVDSMFLDPNNSLMTAAPVDGNGEVTSSVETIKFVGFTRDRIDAIRASTTKIALKGIFNTTNGGTTPIKLYSDYNVNVKVGVKIKPVF
jgi:hypothetical protein